MKRSANALLAAAVAGAMGSAFGACPIDGSTPFLASPIAHPGDPTNPAYTGFSEYLTDSQGLALALCTNAQICFFDPPIAGNAFSEQIGFGAEGFWWLAETTVTGDTGVDGVIVMAAEAAFLNEEPVDGEQFPFTRLRLRIDVPERGIYTVTHPFGEQVYVIGNSGRRAINESFDIEFLPNAINQGRVAPWLTWDTFPGDPTLSIGGQNYIGDINVAHAIKGSPCGNNFFRISATEDDGTTPIVIDPDDQDGDGSDSSLTQTLFNLQGVVFKGNNVQTPLDIGGVTYSRNAGGYTRVNVHASAPSTAVVTYGPTNVPLATDGNGRFFVSDSLLTQAPPTTVVVTADNSQTLPSNVKTSETVDVNDIVEVLSAAWDSATATLTVTARSSDEFNPPTLTLVGDFGSLGQLTEGVATVNNLAVPPANVTVESGNGGRAVAPVEVILQ